MLAGLRVLHKESEPKKRKKQHRKLRKKEKSSTDSCLVLRKCLKKKWIFLKNAVVKFDVTSFLDFYLSVVTSVFVSLNFSPSSFVQTKCLPPCSLTEI